MFNALFSQIPAGSTRQRTLAQGAWLFHQGDAVRSVHFIVDGCVELVRHMPDGKPAVLQRAVAGSMLAEASVFSNCYHCDAIATQDSLLVEMPLRDFRKSVESDAALASAWMEHLARQMQAARMRAEILTLKTVAQRLDAWLAFNDGELPRRGERSRLAEQIGVSPEALYRECARRRR